MNSQKDSVLMARNSFPQVFSLLHRDHRDEALDHVQLHHLPVVSGSDLPPPFLRQWFPWSPTVNP
eukprot:TRINITY_DN2565_c0_g1_i3.p4 TRINITY_DN2565_c0_g1~~TRINITY_DN2565_c0_g1_i3.p4  ORF type:complete len:65 (-),score=10.33 TRINITY_DN2565_c0_g1_i3:45-239(-)